MPKPTIYMMLGIPGAGKTSVAEVVSELTGAVHISSDQFRKHMFDKPEHISEIGHKKLYSMLDYISEQILKSGKSVIYDANLNQYIHRVEKYEICEKIGAKSKVIWVKTELETAKRRATRDAHRHPTHRPWGNMELSTFNRLVEQIEPPKDDENSVIVLGDNVTVENIKKQLSGKV